MTKKITATLGREGLILHIPLEVLTNLLKPRVAFEPMADDFTRREQEVLNGVIQGLANKEIANELSVSESTVKFHVSSLLTKTNTKSRFDLQVLYSGMNGERK